MKKQTQDIQDILKELQENIIELTWRRISDINELYPDFNFFKI